MKSRSCLLLISIILSGSLLHELQAQQKPREPETQRATTQNGRGVVLKKNGRWEYEKVASAADASDLETEIKKAFGAWNKNDVEKIVRETS
jgi:hypothetical protein